jgi:hypothetical protein
MLCVSVAIVAHLELFPERLEDGLLLVLRRGERLVAAVRGGGGGGGGVGVGTRLPFHIGGDSDWCLRPQYGTGTVRRSRQERAITRSDKMR